MDSDELISEQTVAVYRGRRRNSDDAMETVRCRGHACTCTGCNAILRNFHYTMRLL